MTFDTHLSNIYPPWQRTGSFPSNNNSSKVSSGRFVRPFFTVLPCHQITYYVQNATTGSLLFLSPLRDRSP